eukprot:8102830-Pyramimonas_sp.AAC.1
MCIRDSPCPSRPLLCHPRPSRPPPQAFIRQEYAGLGHSRTTHETTVHSLASGVSSVAPLQGREDNRASRVAAWGVPLSSLRSERGTRALPRGCEDNRASRGAMREAR